MGCEHCNRICQDERETCGFVGNQPLVLPACSMLIPTRRHGSSDSAMLQHTHINLLTSRISSRPTRNMPGIRHGAKILYAYSRHCPNLPSSS
jgi:hypothetical protein